MSAQRHRRSQGEGSVFRRKDGKWRGAIDLGWTDGKRVRRWVYGTTEREELVHRNVARLVRPPSARREEVRVLTVEDARRMVDVIQGDRFEALWICALTLGVRKGELLGLRWSDVDFGNSTLTIRQALQRVSGRLVLVEPKTALSRRTVPVPPPALASLRADRTRQNADRLAAGAAWQDSGLVFTTPPGRSAEAAQRKSCLVSRPVSGRPSMAPVS